MTSTWGRCGWFIHRWWCGCISIYKRTSCINNYVQCHDPVYYLSHCHSTAWGTWTPMYWHLDWNAAGSQCHRWPISARCRPHCILSCTAFFSKWWWFRWRSVTLFHYGTLLEYLAMIINITFDCDSMRCVVINVSWSVRMCTVLSIQLQMLSDMMPVPIFTLLHYYWYSISILYAGNNIQWGHGWVECNLVFTTQMVDDFSKQWSLAGSTNELISTVAYSAHHNSEKRTHFWNINYFP